MHPGDEIVVLMNVSVGAEQAVQGQDSLLGHGQWQ